jgi:chaperonin GroES
MKERKIKPAAERILVKKEEVKEVRTEGGIILTERRKEEGATAFGDVIDVGKGKLDMDGNVIRPLFFKPGDKVLFGKYAGMEAVIGKEAFLLMEEVDIIGTVEEV